MPAIARMATTAVHILFMAVLLPVFSVIDIIIIAYDRRSSYMRFYSAGSISAVIHDEQNGQHILSMHHAPSPEFARIHSYEQTALIP